MDAQPSDLVTISIPRALWYFLHPGLWETFFRELGLGVHVSDATTRVTVERAGLVSESEHCLPVKLFDAHLAEVARRADAVFVPRILSTLAGHIACPKLGALPDCTRAQLGDDARVLTIDVDEDAMPLEESLLELGRRRLKKGDAIVRCAIGRALEASHTAHLRIAGRRGNGQSPGDGAATPGNGKKRFLILGHPYNLHDEYFSRPILKKLEMMQVAVDLVAYDVREAPEGPVKWDTCSIMYDTVRRLDRATCAGVIRLSSFNCGCDSILGEILRGLLRDKGIPCLTLVLDEHSAQAGIDTRLEAFVDSMGWSDAVARH